MFLATLGRVCERTGWRVHAWVLMTNHYHLLVETRQANLVAGMRWFQTTYRSDSIGGTVSAATSSKAATRPWS